MMHAIVIDTETSGLFRHRDESGGVVPSDDPSQPHLAELAIIFVDEELQIERTYSGYVKPDGWEMPPEATAVNGLTTEFLLESGKPVDEVLDVFVAAIEEGRIVVAFNAQHDLRAVRGALRRAGRDDLFERTPNICLMRAFAKRFGGKWLKLSAAMEHFGFKAAAEHEALADAGAALDIYRALAEIDGLPEAAVHRAKGRP
jgi:DNA polymerase III subunit epsilon